MAQFHRFAIAMATAAAALLAIVAPAAASANAATTTHAQTAATASATQMSAAVAITWPTAHRALLPCRRLAEAAFDLTGVKGARLAPAQTIPGGDICKFRHTEIGFAEHAGGTTGHRLLRILRASHSRAEGPSRLKLFKATWGQAPAVYTVRVIGGHHITIVWDGRHPYWAARKALNG